MHAIKSMLTTVAYLQLVFTLLYVSYKWMQNPYTQKYNIK